MSSQSSEQEESEVGANENERPIRDESGSKIPWLTSNCGGLHVNGTVNCYTDKKTGARICGCSSKPKAKNYDLYFCLATYVKHHQAHIKDEKAWNKVADSCYNDVSFVQYGYKSGQNFKQVFATAVRDFRNKMLLMPNAGEYETHPNDTPYITLMRGLVKEIDNKKEQRLQKKRNEQTRSSTLMAIESRITPMPSKGSHSSQIERAESDEIIGDRDKDEAFFQSRARTILGEDWDKSAEKSKKHKKHKHDKTSVESDSDEVVWVDPQEKFLDVSTRFMEKIIHTPPSNDSLQLQIRLLELENENLRLKQQNQQSLH